MEVARPKGVSFVCSYCGKQFAGNNFLRRHVKNKHPGSELPECQRSGRKPKKAIAPPQASALFSCDICPRSFGSQRALKLHKKVVHERMYNHRQQAVTMQFSTLSGEFSKRGGIYSAHDSFAAVNTAAIASKMTIASLSLSCHRCR